MCAWYKYRPGQLWASQQRWASQRRKWAPDSGVQERERVGTSQGFLKGQEAGRMSRNGLERERVSKKRWGSACLADNSFLSIVNLINS